MTLQRITALTEPPVVGKFYLVPTVAYPWFGKVKAWPVFPNRHADIEHFHFEQMHYHVDPRFLAPADWRFAKTRSLSVINGFAACQGYPLASRNQMDHPPIAWRRRQCRRDAVPYVLDHIAPVKDLRATFAGQQCAQGRTGWVCPHRNFPLGSFAPVDGVITCPLHGLRIDAETGKVLEPAQ